MGIFDLFKGDQPPLVEQGFEDIQEMLQRGHEMFAAAAAFALDNEILDIDLAALDRKINAREQNLRRVVLEHLTIDPDRELIFSLKLLSIVHEAERIGDIAKSIAKTGALAKQPRLGGQVTPLRDVRDRILRMFSQAEKAFIQADEKAAKALLQDHEQLKDDVSQYIREVAEREDLSANEGVVYALSAQLMSRVSSHLANIASTVAAPFDQIHRSSFTAEQGRRA